MSFNRDVTDEQILNSPDWIARTVAYEARVAKRRCLNKRAALSQKKNRASHKAKRGCKR